jgi:hypothetical protein
MPKSYELREPLRTERRTNHKVAKTSKSSAKPAKIKRRPLLRRMALPGICKVTRMS